MSHAATNWAITRRGLKPAARIVLWHLADCHNPKLGCFPSQEWLAEACEMSRSTVNLHLEKLEEAGLIRRAAGRCPETGKQLPTQYVLGFEIAESREESTKPCPEIGHGREVETVSENGVGPCPKNADIRVRNSDSNPVREPVKEPVKERERVRGDAGEGLEGETASEVAGDGAKPDPATVPGRAEFEKRVLRFCKGDGYQGGEWPKYAGSSFRHIASAFAALDEEDRQAAERWRDAFLAKAVAQGVKSPMAVANFFRDRAWRLLTETEMSRAMAAQARGPAPTSPSGVAEASRPEGWAAGFGPVWAVALVEVLLAGPDRPHPKPEAPLWYPGLIRTNWPALSALHSGKGFVAPERLHRMKDLMEFVPEGGEVWAAWAAEARARGWPDWPRKDGMEGLYFPKGGPDGLAAFNEALAGRNTQGEAAE